MNLEGKGKGILIGALIIGLGPFVPFLNLACCILPILGGIVSVAVYKGSNPVSFTNNDGLVLGLMSGVAGTAIYAVLIVPVTVLMGSTIGSYLAGMTPNIPEIPGNLRPFLNMLFSNLGAVVGVVLFFKVVGHFALSLIFGLIGGVLGIALLKPRTPKH